MSRVKWYNSQIVTDRTQIARDTLWASQITIYFENGDEYVRQDLRGQERGNMFLVSADLKTFIDDSLKEQYSFKNTILDTSTAYILEGSFAFGWLNVDSTKLGDTAFIRQSNDVTYWSQTFQFNLNSIIKLSK